MSTGATLALEDLRELSTDPDYETSSAAILAVWAVETYRAKQAARRATRSDIGEGPRSTGGAGGKRHQS